MLNLLACIRPWPITYARQVQTLRLVCDGTEAGDPTRLREAGSIYRSDLPVSEAAGGPQLRQFRQLHRSSSDIDSAAPPCC